MKKQTLKSEDVYMFTSSLSLLISSGISVREGLHMLQEETTDAHIRKVFQQLGEQLETNATLHQAICACHCFPVYVEYMVKIGEAYGCLDQVLKELTLYYKRDYDLKTQLRQALTYPLILMMMMFVVVGILIFKVLPIFQNVLHSLGSELSWFALSLMNIAEMIAIVGFVLLLCLIIICIYYGVQHFRGKQHPSVLAHFFLTKKLSYALSMAQMTYAFSLFLSSGADMRDAIAVLSKFIDHPQLQQKLITSLAIIEKQHNFADAIGESKLYQGLELTMLQISFRSGKGDETMHQLAQDYEQKVEQAIATFLNILEPSIVAVLSFLVGTILLSVMMPLMSIMSSIG